MSKRWSLSSYLFNSGVPDDCFTRNSWEEKHPILFCVLVLSMFVVVMGFIVFVNLV